MRRFVNEALVQLNALSEHVTTWMAEEPDPREGDADKLTARQWVLVRAGYIKGALEAGLAAAEITDPSAALAAAVGHVRDLEGQLDLVDARRSAAEKRASEAEASRSTRSDEVCRYILAICGRNGGDLSGPTTETERAAVDAVWVAAGLCDSMRKEADSLRSKLAKEEAARAGDARLLDEAMSDRDTAIEQRDLARAAVHGYRESCDEVHRLLTAAGVTGEDDAPVRVQRLIAERDGLRDKTRSQSSAAPAADRNAIGIDPAATCGECSKYRSDGYCADIDACVGGGDDACGSFTRRMPETPAAAARVADLALARWRAMRGEDRALLPEMCIGCAHAAKSAAEDPCASCVYGSGRGENRREVGYG